jgi:CheY-like chemotaxis protein
MRRHNYVDRLPRATRARTPRGVSPGPSTGQAPGLAMPAGTLRWLMQQTTPPPGKTILVIEDDPVIREGLVMAVEAANCLPVTAANGQEALTLLRAGTAPDLIILDLLMPVMDGWKFRQEQLRDPDLASIPVFVLSARADLARAATNLGVAQLLQKPVDFNHLLECIRGFTQAQKPGVLVADDQAQVRTMLALALRHYGFLVWVAASGRDAVDFYRTHQEAITVVLLDVRMPDLSGPDTLVALQRINPRVRCCFMSGDTGAFSRDALLRMGAADVLMKPFGLLDVSDALRRVLRPAK